MPSGMSKIFPESCCVLSGAPATIGNDGHSTEVRFGAGVDTFHHADRGTLLTSVPNGQAFAVTCSGIAEGTVLPGWTREEMSEAIRASDRLPAAPDSLPAASDRLPATSDRRPAASDRRPAASDGRLAASDRRPTASDRLPTASDRRPAAS